MGKFIDSLKSVVKIAKSDKDIVSIDNTYAAVNIVKYKIQKVTFTVGIISTILFLAYYGYMIYDRMDDSLVHTIIYSLLSALLIISTIFDIILFPGNKRIMSFLEKRKLKFHKKVKRRLIIIFKLIIKATSIGYATYELIAIDYSTLKLMMLIASILILTIQLVIYFIADLAVSYFQYIVVGFNKDIEDSGIMEGIDKDNSEKIKANDILRLPSEKQILKEIETQKAIDKVNKEIDKNIRHRVANTNKN